MKLKELFKNDDRYIFIEIEHGCSNSINRTKDSECIVAHKKIDRLIYLIIKNTKEFRFYRIVNFDGLGKFREFSGEELSGKNKKYIFNLKGLTIVDKNLFEKAQRQVMLEALED